MRRSVIGFLFGVAALFGWTGAAQAEFELDFYNGSRCMNVEWDVNDGVRSIVAKNLCNANVAALICYKIRAGNDVYDRSGWYCNYSNLYGPGSTRTISRGGRYHPKFKWAACNAANQRCDQVIRTIGVRVRDNYQDPEEVGLSIRTQSGG